MSTRTDRKQKGVPSIELRIHRLYLRLGILNEAIRNLEKYDSWVKRDIGSTNSSRCRRFAA